jgi:exopolysaccharide production protein ExoQ
MPPLFALLLCLCLVAWLFWRYPERQAGVSYALWIPLVWLFIVSSRPVSLWIGAGGGSADADGSPLDSLVFVVLIVAGAVVLSKRRLNWAALFRQNQWLLVFFVYLGLSTLWSDSPFVSFKRWIKDLGNIIMVLVVVTDQNPIQAVRFLLARCCYLLLPLNITIIKYFPDLGRAYDQWTGIAFYCGISTDKNMLGMTLFACSLALMWMLFQPDRNRTGIKARLDLGVLLLMGGMALWLLQQAHSSTALSSTLLGAAIICITRIAPIRKNLGMYGVVLGAVIVFLQLAFNLTESLTQLVGRDLTFTGRTDIWSALLQEKTDPLFGVGYYSFWLGDRIDRLSANYFYHLNEAHDTYLETYLNSGLIGVALLSVLIISSLIWIKNEAMKSEPFGTFRLACFLAMLVYGITEAFMNRLGFLWFLFLLVIVRIPKKIPVQTGGQRGFAALKRNLPYETKLTSPRVRAVPSSMPQR